MANVVITDNSVQVKEGFKSTIIAWLNEIGGELSSQAARSSPVDTGQLKGSWAYQVNDGEQKVEIGSPLKNSIWNEFGTGQYALHGDGRKTKWVYQDVHGQWHTTVGKRPQRTLHNAFTSMQNKIVKSLESKLKGG